MITVARTTQSTVAKPEAIFALWADINHWAEFDQGIEWARLSDKFEVGCNYMLKPKGGPKVRAEILQIETNKKFVDISYLWGARLTLDHQITERADGKREVSIVMMLDGPLGWLWSMILGKNQQEELERSTANLIKKAEAS